jgi:hypothetical protein
MRRKSAPSTKISGCRGEPGPGTAPKTGPARTRQRPARARTRLTVRKTVAEVPLAGLSFGLSFANTLRL